LKANLEELNTSLAEAQKASQVTEVNYALQAQDLASVRRELATLREKPNLEEVVAELREKNQEMDELLRQKSTEIEENDDRFIEYVPYFLCLFFLWLNLCLFSGCSRKRRSCSQRSTY
jgi:hypothetical protein